MLNSLTDKQRRVFETISECMNRDERPPTTRELAEKLNCHIKTIYQYLQVLDRKGLTERRKGRIFISKAHRRTGLPILGCVAAGTPILAEENLEGFLSLNELYGKNADFVLRVKGDSMINAHICDGDHVVVHRQPTVENGEIGVVLIGEEATVKRVRIEEERLLLFPENDAFNIMEFDLSSTNACVLGKVIGVVRNAM